MRLICCLVSEAGEEAWVLLSACFSRKQIAIDAAFGSLPKLREGAVAKIVKASARTLAELRKEISKEGGSWNVSWWKRRWDCFARTPKRGSQDDVRITRWGYKSSVSQISRDNQSWRLLKEHNNLHGNGMVHICTSAHVTSWHVSIHMSKLFSSRHVFGL